MTESEEIEECPSCGYEMTDGMCPCGFTAWSGC